MEFDPDAGDEGKVGGTMLPDEVLIFFWLCWVIEHSSRIAKMTKEGKNPLVLPDVSHLLTSVFLSCGLVVEEDESIWRGDIAAVDNGVPAQKLQAWILTTVPGLASCLAKYVQERIQAYSASEVYEVLFNHCPR